MHYIWWNVLDIEYYWQPCHILIPSTQEMGDFAGLSVEAVRPQRQTCANQVELLQHSEKLETNRRVPETIN